MELVPSTKLLVVEEEEHLNICGKILISSDKETKKSPNLSTIAFLAEIE